MKNFRARGRSHRRHVEGEMNKTEQRYAEEVLDPKVASGDISDYKFEAIKLRLAKRGWYTPDFAVRTKNGFLEFHEIKAFRKKPRPGPLVEDDALLKWKAAAEQFPWYSFRMLWKQPGVGWCERTYD